MTDEEIAESIRAALNPWAAGSYVAGIWMLALMGVFGTARDERFWLLLSGGCAAIYFFSVVALHRRQLGRLALFTAGVTAATVGAVVALGDTDLRVPAERRFAVVKYDETVMSDDEVERAARDLLDDVDVQVWIKRVVGVRNVDTFPAGVRVAADDGVLEIQVPFSVTWSDATAFDVAVAFAVALEGRHPELRRTQSGSEALQRKLEAAPPVPPRVEPPRPAPGMRDAAVAAPAREGS